VGLLLRALRAFLEISTDSLGRQRSVPAAGALNSNGAVQQVPRSAAANAGSGM